MSVHEITLALSTISHDKLQQAADHTDMSIDEFVLWAALETAQRVNDAYRF